MPGVPGVPGVQFSWSSGPARATGPVVHFRRTQRGGIRPPVFVPLGHLVSLTVSKPKAKVPLPGKLVMGYFDYLEVPSARGHQAREPTGKMGSSVASKSILYSLK